MYNTIYIYIYIYKYINQNSVQSITIYSAPGAACLSQYCQTARQAVWGGKKKRKNTKLADHAYENQIWVRIGKSERSKKRLFFQIRYASRLYVFIFSESLWNFLGDGGVPHVCEGVSLCVWGSGAKIISEANCIFCFVFLFDKDLRTRSSSR